MKNDLYYCVNNIFSVAEYTDSKTDFKLEINKLYYLNFGGSMRYFDIYDGLNYIGWTLMDNLKFFKTEAEFLADWRDKQINKILNDD